MAFWLELHCDTPANEAPSGCAQMKADHPGVLVRNQDVSDGIKWLRDRAKALGYTKTRTGWRCRVCSTQSPA